MVVECLFESLSGTIATIGFEAIKRLGQLELFKNLEPFYERWSVVLLVSSIGEITFVVTFSLKDK